MTALPATWPPSHNYASVDDAVKLILRLGQGAQLVKLDLKNAYRIVPVHPQDQHLLGISWEGKSYANQALPFGLHSAPNIFSVVANNYDCIVQESSIKSTIWMIFCSWEHRQQRRQEEPWGLL